MTNAQASVAYQLVLDNKKRIDTDSYLKDEMTEAHDAQLQYPSGLLPQTFETPTIFSPWEYSLPGQQWRCLSFLHGLPFPEAKVTA